MIHTATFCAENVRSGINQPQQQLSKWNEPNEKVNWNPKKSPVFGWLSNALSLSTYKTKYTFAHVPMYACKNSVLYEKLRCKFSTVIKF